MYSSPSQAIELSLPTHHSFNLCIRPPGHFVVFASALLIQFVHLQAIQLPSQAQTLLAVEPQCLVARATFDRDWMNQQMPDPNVKPQSFPALSRVMDHFPAQLSRTPTGEHKNAISVKDVLGHE